MYFVKSFFLFSLLIALEQFSVAKTSKLFGTYIIRNDDYRECKGPKSKNSSKIYVEIDSDRREIIRGNATFFAKTRLEELFVIMLNEKTKQNVYTYKFKNPCQHQFVDSVLYSMVKVKNCVFHKGFYEFSDINLDQYAHSFIGNTFLYGKVSVKTYGTSKNANVYCFMFRQSISEP